MIDSSKNSTKRALLIRDWLGGGLELEEGKVGGWEDKVLDWLKGNSSARLVESTWAYKSWKFLFHLSTVLLGIFSKKNEILIQNLNNH